MKVTELICFFESAGRSGIFRILVAIPYFFIFLARARCRPYRNHPSTQLIILDSDNSHQITANTYFPLSLSTVGSDTSRARLFSVPPLSCLFPPAIRSLSWPASNSFLAWKAREQRIGISTAQRHFSRVEQLRRDDGRARATTTSSATSSRNSGSGSD